MICCKRCSQVGMDKVYEAFSVGYSDYIIKVKMERDEFEKRFFGPEGNSPDNSFVAFDGEAPVGLILGGIKEYEGIKTLRCGTFAVHPDYRGGETSKKLFELHRQEAINNGCRQLFLEVIAGNDRAVNFYKKVGYNKVYDISYFTLNNTEKLNIVCQPEMMIKKISKDVFLTSMKQSSYDHINWQNDLEYIEKLENMSFYGAYMNDKLAGSACVSPNGKIFFLYVDKCLRLKGTGKALLCAACSEMAFQKLSISFPNNSSLEGFARHIGFEKDAVSQFEMYNQL